MKKITQKKVKEYLKNIEDNFSELIDAVIYYEKKDMDDWSYEIINHIEQKSNDFIIKKLFEDIEKRTEEDKENLLYKGIWYALINTEPEKEKTHKIILEKMHGHKNEELIFNFIKSLDENENTEGEINAQQIIKKYKM